MLDGEVDGSIEESRDIWRTAVRTDRLRDRRTRVRLDGTHQAVVRIGLLPQADVLQQGLRLAAQLKSLGVPLPDILGHGRHEGFPYVSMMRLPGTDLGHVLHMLSIEQLRRIAEAVSDAQVATARLGRGTGFGYASTVGDARLLDRCCSGAYRTLSAEDRDQRLFSVTVVESVEGMLSAYASQLDTIEPTPFLHDTTTKNVIVSPEGYLSGIVDVDDLCYGDPRYLAALTAAALLNSGAPIDYVSAWLARAGQAWDGLFEFYVATFLLDFMSKHGMAFNGNEVASVAQDREKLGRLLQETVSRAEAESPQFLLG